VSCLGSSGISHRSNFWLNTPAHLPMCGSLVLRLAMAACGQWAFGTGPESPTKTLHGAPNLVGLPLEFEAVVFGCLMKDPVLRPKAAALELALHRIAGHETEVDEDESETAGSVIRDGDEDDAPAQQVVTAGATADPVKDYLKQIGKVACSTLSRKLSSPSASRLVSSPRRSSTPVARWM